jgi:hypothetical protein
MITGFNTDVDHDDRVFHVQTEDKGLDNPIIESLIYCGGEIIDTRQNSYAEVTESEEFSEDTVLEQMETQHQTMIREILNGRFDTQGPKPFGHKIITNRSLDEVVLDFLGYACEVEEIRLQLIDEQVLTEGTRPTLRLKVVKKASGRPVHGAQVTIKLISTRERPRELFVAPSDDEGFVEAVCEIPDLPGANGAILCEAMMSGKKAQVRQLIRKTKGRPKIAADSPKPA